jgi:hypothetical protein
MKLFLHRSSDNIQTSNLIQITPVKANCSMRKDRRTDITRLMVAFRNFANAPKNSHKNLSQCHFAHAPLFGTQHTLLTYCHVLPTDHGAASTLLLTEARTVNPQPSFSALITTLQAVTIGAGQVPQKLYSSVTFNAKCV